MPVYVDVNTKRPLRTAQDAAEARDDFVYMDATGFGMGCCCLQTTFQVFSNTNVLKLVIPGFGKNVVCLKIHIHF